jgi:hypothetical protein
MLAFASQILRHVPVVQEHRGDLNVPFFSISGSRERCEIPNVATGATPAADEIYVRPSDGPKYQDQ